MTRGNTERPTRGERALVRRRVDEAVAWEHEVSGGTYGAPRICHALMRGGVDVGVRAVAQSMRRLGLTGLNMRPRPARPRRGLIDFARNLPATVSNYEFMLLEFQCFGALLKAQAIELRATIWGSGPAALVSSHAIPSRVFHSVRLDYWNCMRNWGGLFSVVELVAQGYCTTCAGDALLSCQCTAALSGALVLYLVHRFAVVKLVTPLRPCVSAGLKPVTPLRGENAGFPAVEGLQRCWRFHW